MKIAIHHKKGSFSSKWIEYCKKKQIDYKIINCYDNDVIDKVEDCDALMWHFHQADPKDILFAKQLVYSLQTAGKKVFPDFHTAWHFDDKVGQKYLLEAVDAPLVPSYVFYDKHSALQWIDDTVYPKVFKLRRGAGSAHVKLVENKRGARKLVRKAFSKGFHLYDKMTNLKERWYKYRKGKGNVGDVVKGILRFGKTTDFAKIAGNERGYVYFQDFIPGNDHDIRVVVIGERAFAIKRMVRENDFRASGSTQRSMDKNSFRSSTIKLAFEIAEKLNSQCVAFDFIYDNEMPKIVEISYGFVIDEVPGFWDKSLNWHDGPVTPQHWMVESLISQTS